MVVEDDLARGSRCRGRELAATISRWGPVGISLGWTAAAVEAASQLCR